MQQFSKLRYISDKQTKFNKIFRIKPWGVDSQPSSGGGSNVLCLISRSEDGREIRKRKMEIITSSSKAKTPLNTVEQEECFISTAESSIIIECYGTLNQVIEIYNDNPVEDSSNDFYDFSSQQIAEKEKDSAERRTSVREDKYEIEEDPMQNLEGKEAEDVLKCLSEIEKKRKRVPFEILKDAKFTKNSVTYEFEVEYKKG